MKVHKNFPCKSTRLSEMFSYNQQRIFLFKLKVYMKFYRLNLQENHKYKLQLPVSREPGNT